MQFGGFTLHYTEKKVKELKEKLEYKRAIEILEGVIARHSKKEGLWALFKNERGLQDLLDEIRPLRFKQCMEEAGCCLRDESDPTKMKEKPLDKRSLPYYEQARELLEEALKIEESAEAKRLLCETNSAIGVIQTYVLGEGRLTDRCLEKARECFREIRDLHPDARRCLNEIDAGLNRCRALKQEISEAICRKDFTSARRELDHLRSTNREDQDYAGLLRKVEAKEEAAELLARARKSENSKDLVSLTSALEDLKRAKDLDPEYGEIAKTDRELRVQAAPLYYNQALQYRDQEKDIEEAIKSFSAIEALGVPYMDTADLLKDLLDIENKIQTQYEKGISAGKALEAAIDAFSRAEGYGFRYRDLGKRLSACRDALEECLGLLSEAEALMRPSRKDYDTAIAKIQEALILYPAFEKGLKLLDEAKRQKEVQERLKKALACVEGKDFRYKDAFAEVRSALAIDPENLEANALRDTITQKTFAWLEKATDKCRKDNRQTTGIRVIEDVAGVVEVAVWANEALAEFRANEDRARSSYQNGFLRLKEARECEATNEPERGRLYGEARTLFTGAMALNRDASEVVQPELETLDKELEEWRAYLEAKRLFGEGNYGSYESCLKTLQPYREKPMLSETQTLIVAVLNRLGFAGSFQLKVEGKTYVIIPDEKVHVGRNTSSFKENHISLRLQDVSKKHGTFKRLGESYFYEDRGSHHGTLINGKAMDRQVELKDRDALGFGFFKEEDGVLTNEAPVVRLRLSLYPCEVVPSLKIVCEPSDHEDFKEDTSRIYILMGARFTVGSGKGNAVALRDSSVAPEHIEIGREQNRYLVRDLGTPGGSFVNNEPLLAQRTLQLGDRIKIGSVETAVEEVE